MNILITGVHGFVGSNLVKYLAKGNTIYGLDIVQPQKEGVKCTFSWEVLDIEGVMPGLMLSFIWLVRHMIRATSRLPMFISR